MINLLPSHHRTYLLLNKRIPFKAAQDECSLRFRPRGHSQTRLMAEYLRVRVGVVSGFDQVDSLPSSDSTYNPFVLRKPSFTPSFTPMLISHMLGITDHSKRSHRSNTNLNGAERSKFIEFRKTISTPTTYIPIIKSITSWINPCETTSNEHCRYIGTPFNQTRERYLCFYAPANCPEQLTLSPGIGLCSSTGRRKGA